MRTRSNKDWLLTSNSTSTFLRQKLTNLNFASNPYVVDEMSSSGVEKEKRGSGATVRVCMHSFSRQELANCICRPAILAEDVRENVYGALVLKAVRLVSLQKRAVRLHTFASQERNRKNGMR